MHARSHFCEMPRTGRSTATAHRQVVARGLGGGRGVTANGCGASSRVMDVQLCVDTENHWTVHVRRVNCRAHELYLNKAIITNARKSL